MSELIDQLQSMDLSPDRTSKEVNAEIAKFLKEYGYDIALIDHNRPWGGYTQLEDNNAPRFLTTFFTGLSLEEAQNGNPEAKLTPKVIGICPGERLSWQYHERRAESWMYVTDGGYFRSLTDEPGVLQYARAGEMVQMARAERHRLVGAVGHYTIVAEAWQHTDPNNLSNEADIVRLQDDYKR